jgi:hypothetical protein
MQLDLQAYGPLSTLLHAMPASGIELGNVQPKWNVAWTLTLPVHDLVAYLNTDVMMTRKPQITQTRENCQEEVHQTNTGLIDSYIVLCPRK